MFPMETKVFTDRLRKINSYFQYFPVSETKGPEEGDKIQSHPA
jgi:hypothetical protein